MAHQWVTFAPIYVNPDKNKQDWIIIESAINWLLIRLIIHLSVSFITQVWLHIRVLYSWPLPHFLGSPSTRHCTGSRGDVFVVRTSKPVENLWKNGLFWSRCSFVTHSIDRKPRDWGLARSAYSIKYFYSALRASVALRATCRAPARIWLAVIDFQKSIWVR